MRVADPLQADAVTSASEPVAGPSWPRVGVNLLIDLYRRSPAPDNATDAGPDAAAVAAPDAGPDHAGPLAVPIVDDVPALVCSDVAARYRNRRRPTISGIDLVLPRNGVLAVVGPSGAGKSTLCAAVLGEVEDVTGHVLVDGVALLEAPDLAPRLVSFVPQRDALHTELTPRQALRLTADLRLAPSVPQAERERRVAEVLSLLELATHADRRIGQLSGGQRKRVAVAMELLSNPRLLMLDEPTSGLDEGLDLVMMQLLRRVADGGRGVVVITHSTANLHLADVVLALDIHGRVAFSGAPSEFLGALGADTYAEAMAALRSGTATAETVTGAPLAGDGTDTAALRVDTIAAAVAARTRRASSALAPEIGLLHTAVVLTRRELTRLRANKLTLARGLVALPVLAALLTAWGADEGLSGDGFTSNSVQVVALSVLITCTTFFAMALSFGAIVGDREVIEREFRWGVRPVGVVAAKVLALGGPVVVQSVVTMALYLWLREGPSTPLDVVPPFVAITGSLALLGLASMALGLLVSASTRTLERAILVLMGFVALLTVLNGLLIPLAHPEGFGGKVLALVAHLTPSRWGTAAVASYIQYRPTPLPDAPPGDTSQLDALWTHDVAHFTDALVSMSSLGVAYVVGAMILLTRQLGRRR
jgi:ABC-type multidrug transport system ATPase subunit